MITTPLKRIAVTAVAIAALSHAALARDVTITLPMPGRLSPVQRLNREGVEAVKKHQYDKAETFFYRAYLYDPADPFTLNNLGYISEFRGQLEAAHKFYQLASEQSCNASIDVSSTKSLENKPMRAALDNLEDLSMRVNRINIDAMRLLSQDRAFESAALLQQALALDSQNPFTLNNLGVADEAIGDYPDALKNYALASKSRSSDQVIVTQNRAWSGKSVSAMAEASAKRLEKRLRDTNSAETQAAMFNLRGVFLANQNNWIEAQQNFLRAYSLDPADAFSVNNRGYIAEHQGDLESAQFFYQKARRLANPNTLVGVATEQSSEGHMLTAVAADSNRKVGGALETYGRKRQQQTAPIELTPRGAGSAPNATQPLVGIPSTPVVPDSSNPAAKPAPQQ
jgi:Flp pilus assembly protein TadD